MSINLEAVGLRVNPLAWEQIGDFLRARGIRCTYFLNSVGTATIQGEGFGSHIMGERSDAERHHEQQVLSMLEPCEAVPTAADIDTLWRAHAPKEVRDLLANTEPKWMRAFIAAAHKEAP